MPVSPEDAGYDEVGGNCAGKRHRNGRRGATTVDTDPPPRRAADQEGEKEDQDLGSQSRFHGSGMVSLWYVLIVFVAAQAGRDYKPAEAH